MKNELRWRVVQNKFVKRDCLIIEYRKHVSICNDRTLRKGIYYDIPINYYSSNAKSLLIKYFIKVKLITYVCILLQLHRNIIFKKYPELLKKTQKY